MNARPEERTVGFLPESQRRTLIGFSSKVWERKLTEVGVYVKALCGFGLKTFWKNVYCVVVFLSLNTAAN